MMGPVMPGDDLAIKVNRTTVRPYGGSIQFNVVHDGEVIAPGPIFTLVEHLHMVMPWVTPAVALMFISRSLYEATRYGVGPGTESARN